MTLKKADMVDLIAERNGFTKKQSTEILQTLIEIIKSTLASGEDVLVSGFGKFRVQNKGLRKGRNPATGEPLMLDARKIITFKCSEVLRDKMNVSSKN
jgi:integration host factor subunit alpha